MTWLIALALPHASATGIAATVMSQAAAGRSATRPQKPVSSSSAHDPRLRERGSFAGRAGGRRPVDARSQDEGRG
jgi:hypothetical protein